MTKRSLQKIEDFYKNKGYSGSELKKILKKDREWVALVKLRKQNISKTFRLTKHEQNKYVMSTNEDYEILQKVKELEKMKLTKEEKEIVSLIKSQLIYDWRGPLLIKLKKIMQRHQHNGNKIKRAS